MTQAIKTKGFKQLNRMLKRVPEKTKRKFIRQAVRSAMRPIKKEILNKAPVGEIRSPSSLKYGRIIQNIKLRVRKSRNDGSLRAFVTTSKAFWSYFYEKGTVKQKARPWFYEAGDSKKDLATQIMKERLDSLIKKEWRK